MICRFCGKDNPADEVFCLTCGKPLTREHRRSEKKYKRSTYRPEDAEAAGEEAASPNEYFPDEAYYGETEPFRTTAPSRQRARRLPAEKPVYRQDYSSEYPSEYPPGYPSDYSSEYAAGYPDAYAGAYAGAYDARAAARPKKRKSRVPYLIVSFLTALTSVLCFILPYREWVSFHYSLFDYQVSDGSLSLSELAKRFYDNKGILSLITGYEDEELAALVPDSINSQYAQGRFFAMIVAVVFLVSLVFYAIFILSALFRLRGAAATFGIIASLLYGGASFGVIMAVGKLNEIIVEYDGYAWNVIEYRLLDAPYIAMGVAALIFLLCILFAILGAGTRRR